LTRTSPPEYRLILSPKAQQDVENILRYTGEQWGEKQISIYRDRLTGALETIPGNPASGHLNAELPETHRVYPVGSHVIVYRIQADVVGAARESATTRSQQVARLASFGETEKTHDYRVSP
jgi:toxin ParE1/3/4